MHFTDIEWSLFVATTAWRCRRERAVYDAHASDAR
jgi:hypothetical protein